MRAFLIACVLVFTMLTFYSALWYKSEEIEADITTRVTEELAETGASGVGVDVDGRHVTLSGVVYDEATETAYLETADQTYGALGPIDGLTYLSGGGFIKAVKSDTGIMLTGTVPTEDARAALVAAATEATDGEVDDQLNIGGAAGDWQDEAGFGLAQMSGLSAGALAVAPQSYTLSGIADGDIAPIRSSFADRAGWQTFVSSPAVEMGLNDEVARLTGEASTSAQSIATLSGERDTLGQSLADLTAERDGLNATLETVTGERDAISTELQDLRASLDDNQTSAATLNANLADARGEIAARDETIEGLNGQLNDLTSQNADLEAQLASQQAALNGDQSEFSALQETLKERDGTIATLTGDLAQRDSTIADLETKLTTEQEAHVTADAQIDDLSDQLKARTDRVAVLEGELEDAQAQVADLNDQVTSQNTGDTDAAARIAALTASVADEQAKVSTLDTELDGIKAVVAERDATIAELRNAPAPTPAAPDNTTRMAQQCAVRASAVLENARINFGTANANIEQNSVGTLERLTGIALACVDSGLTVEIGGHTDSQGTDENNQALSERRAQAILAFMSERGVPTEGLKAVGYGESNPIADNNTPEGRAQNRRISFDWQAR